MSKQAELTLLDESATACCPPLIRRPLDARQAEELAAAFKALGDPVRLRLLSLIAAHEGGEACVCEVTGAFDLSQPTISHHLRKLREAGLIDCERRGTWVYYWVIPERLAALSGVLATPAGATSVGATPAGAVPAATPAGAAV